MSKRSTPDGEAFHGWRVVWALLVILTIVFGLSFYNHSVILDALARNPEFSVESASWAVSLFFISAGLGGLWIGRLLQKFDPRWCLSLGAVLGAVSLTALSRVDSLFQLYAVYVLFGIGFSASALLPCTTLVAQWFEHRRAIALSIATTGMSLGGVVVTPVCAAFVNKVGLQTAGPVMGLAYLLGVLPITWLFIKPKPRTGFAGGSHTNSSAPALSAGLSYSEALRHRFFWAVSFAFVFQMMSQVGGIAHQFGRVSEVLSAEKAAAAVAILPVTSIVGRLVGGWILSYVSLKGFALVVMLAQLVGLTVLSLSDAEMALYLSLALFGATVGNLLMLQSLIVAEGFGVRDYTRIFSLNSLLVSFGAAAGPGLLGLVYAMESSYSLSYGLAAAASLAGVLCFLFAGRFPSVKKSAA